MTFGQLIEHNMKNIFLEKSYIKCGGENSPRTFSEKIKIEYISGSAFWNFIQFVFSVYLSRGLPKYIETKVLITCFTSYKAFLKNKKKPGTSFPVPFSAWFLKKNIFQVIFY